MNNLDITISFKLKNDFLKIYDNDTLIIKNNDNATTLY